MSESIFFVKLPPLQQLCHVILQVTDNNFHFQVLKCRQLLSACSSVIAAPQIDNRNFIDAIVHVDFYKKNFGFLCRKVNLKPIQAAIAKNIFVEQCFLYTIKFKLSPQWNQVGSLLVANTDFLLCHGKLEAVKFDVTFREEEMTIKIKSSMIRIPPPKLESFGICPQALEMFSGDGNYSIPEEAINLQWCHILPTMKKGQLVKISHKMPPNSTKYSFLNNFEGLKKYWKTQYGYCLPQSEDDMIYCSVFFKQINSSLFTYPLICLRNKPIQFMPRCDDFGITKRFFDELRQNFSHICGLPVVFSDKACSSSTILSIASKLKPGIPPNVRLIDHAKSQSFCDISLLQKLFKEMAATRAPLFAKMTQVLVLIVLMLTIELEGFLFSPLQVFLKKVPSENIIAATQKRSENEDLLCRAVPSSGEKLQSSAEKKTSLSCFPTTSEGKYIPVFNKKATRPSSMKRTGTTISKAGIMKQNVHAKTSEEVLMKKPLLKGAKKKSLHVTTSRRIEAPVCSLAKKHKFDELFSSASSTSVLLQHASCVGFPKGKPKKHHFDELFQSASSSLSKDSFRDPTCQNNRKKSQFDKLFKPASILS